uniref:Replicase polyprotein 1a n=1 Tax=Lygus hesperus TaxID=30085 RepID=A0A0A9Y7C6_LYGHE
MECSSSSYFNRKTRCHRDRTFQEVPGRTSFRQEWPIRLCEPVACRERTYVEEEENVVDPCDEFDEKKEDEEGPLDRFDKSMKEYMTMDIWGREAPKSKQQTQPPILARTTANTLETTEDLATEDANNRSFAKRLAAIEKHFLFEQALMFAEQAADAAPPELVEEAALASARGIP